MNFLILFKGPTKYIKLYDKYSGLLSGQADQEKDDFLARKDAPLEEFKSNMDRYLALSNEVSSIRDCAMLNLFEIDAAKMNKKMSDHAYR